MDHKVLVGNHFLVRALISGLLLTGTAACDSTTGHTGKPTTPTFHPTGKESSESARASDKKLEDQVRSVVGPPAVGEPGFVESGVERLSDGIHNQSTLDPQKAHKLVLACADKGQVNVTVQWGRKKLNRTLQCDGVTTRYSLPEGIRLVQFDATGAEQKTKGFIAFQISEAGSPAA